MYDGYVRLYRKTLKSDIWQNPNAYRVFEYLLLRAMFRPHKYFAGGKCIDLVPGQFISSTRVIAKECRLGHQATRTALAYLKLTQRITQHVTHNFTTYTITKWDYYQNPDDSNNTEDITEDNTPVTHHQHTGNTPVTREVEFKQLRTKEEDRDWCGLPLPDLSGPQPSNGFSPEDMARLWNEAIDFFSTDQVVTIPKVQKLHADRKKKAMCRIKDCHIDEPKWRAIINAIHKSQFLSGVNPSRGHADWRATFDFVIRSEAVITKILEGGYQ